MSLPATVQLVGKQQVLGGAKYFQPASSVFPLGIEEEQRAGHSVQRSSAPEVSKPDSAAAAGSVPACPPTGVKAKLSRGGGPSGIPSHRAPKERSRNGGHSSHTRQTRRLNHHPYSSEGQDRGQWPGWLSGTALAQHVQGPGLCPEPHTQRERRKEKLKYHTGCTSWLGS